MGGDGGEGVFNRLRIGPFEEPANVKPPALPEVDDSKYIASHLLFLYGILTQNTT